jgi:hypothetical protein
MNKYFVYYDDGAVGFRSFNELKDAREFIEGRLSADHSRKLNMYQLVLGEQLFTKEVETVTRITVIKSPITKENGNEQQSI